jgi:hypothetical protein
MPSPSHKHIRSLSQPMQYGPNGDFAKAWLEIEEASDRVAAIVAAAVVEDALRWALNSFFMPRISEQDEKRLFDNDGILSFILRQGPFGICTWPVRRGSKE